MSCRPTLPPRFKITRCPLCFQWPLEFKNSLYLRFKLLIHLLSCLTLTIYMLVDRTIKLGESQDSLRMVLQPALRCLDRPVSQQSAIASRIKRVEAPRAGRWTTLEGAPITCAARPRLGAMVGLCRPGEV